VGGAVTTFATNVNQPYGLAFDSKTNLFAACFNLNRILRISTTGTVSNFASVQGPYGLAVDVGDNVYAASTVASRILRITPGGAASVFGPYVSSPQGLAFDPFGNLYVASYSGTITRITPAGAGSTYASGLNSLVGVVFDNSGNLYAASYITGTIYRIAPDQTVTTFATIPGNPSFIAVNPVPSFRPGLIGLAATGGNLVLTWEGPFTLQSTPELQSPYLDETNATSPWTNTLSAAGSRFFRLRK
jgi:sugar lactone lactonase YvrE